MHLSFRSLGAKALVILTCIPLLVLAACGSTGTTTTGTDNPNAGVTLTVGGKLDTEAKILTKLYTLVLQDEGFKVNEKAAFGNNTLVFEGIKSGKLDLYPEFTASGLDALKEKSSLDDQKDYDTVKAAFKEKFQIDWLDYSPLNDTYAICVNKDVAQKDNLKTISDLAAKAKNYTFDLPSDSFYVFDFLTPYKLNDKSFKSIEKVDYAVGFKNVGTGGAQANFCYSTDLGITKNNLVVLEDDQKAFPAYHPAPIVRESVLQKSPAIKDALNKLAPKLTTQASLDLQKSVSDNQEKGMSQAKAITEAAHDFLKANGFCTKRDCK